MFILGLCEHLVTSLLKLKEASPTILTSLTMTVVLNVWKLRQTRSLNLHLIHKFIYALTSSRHHCRPNPYYTTTVNM